MVKDDRKKNPSFIAFFKLFLFDLKVEIMLISWHFFMAFCIQTPLPPLQPTLSPITFVPLLRVKPNGSG